MNLEPIIHSEASQNHKYDIWNMIYEQICLQSRKIVLMNLVAGQQWRCWLREHLCTQNRKERVGKKAEADEFHLWPKNHDLDLFPFNTNLLSLNQEQVKLKSVRSQSYFCSRFTLSSAMSSEYIRMQWQDLQNVQFWSVLFLLF